MKKEKENSGSDKDFSSSQERIVEGQGPTPENSGFEIGKCTLK